MCKLCFLDLSPDLSQVGELQLKFLDFALSHAEGESYSDLSLSAGLKSQT